MVDLCVAGAAFVLLLPFMIIVGAVVYCTMGSPVLFRPMRPGYKAKPFRLLKFRTMTTACDSQGELLPDRDRLTSLGKFLRRYSLDELPQLWNVLRGDMSLVGPRPLLRRELSDYGAVISLYERVRPGITGLWQISGRSHTTFAERVSYDEWYIKNWTVWYDLVIMLQTVWVLLHGEGAY